MSTISTTLYNEEKNKKKSLRISVAIHILILLIALYPILRDDPMQNIDKQYAVAIAFDNLGASNSFKGQAAEGKQRPLNETVDRVRTAPMEKIPNKNPNKSVPQPKVQVPVPQTPTAEAESDIFEEESDVMAVEEVPEVVNEVPKQKVQTNTKTNKTTVETDSDDDVEDVPVQVPEAISSPVSDKGNNSSSPSNKNGSGTGQGNKGKGAGKDKSGNDSTSGMGTGGVGVGAFDGSGKGIFGRQPVSRPKRSMLNLEKSGKITFKICIDRKGRSTFVDVMKRGTTIRDKAIIKKAIDYVGSFLWEEDYNVPREQCGKYTLKIGNKVNN